MVIGCERRRLLQQGFFDHSLRDWLNHLRQIGEMLAHRRCILVEIGLEQIDGGGGCRKGCTKLLSRIIMQVLWLHSTSYIKSLGFKGIRTLVFCWLSIHLHGCKCISHDCKGCKQQTQTYALYPYYQQITQSHSILVAYLHNSRYCVPKQHYLPHGSCTAQDKTCSQPIDPPLLTLHATNVFPYAKHYPQ